MPIVVMAIVAEVYTIFLGFQELNVQGIIDIPALCGDKVVGMDVFTVFDQCLQRFATGGTEAVLAFGGGHFDVVGEIEGGAFLGVGGGRVFYLGHGGSHLYRF